MRQRDRQPDLDVRVPTASRSGASRGTAELRCLARLMQYKSRAVSRIGSPASAFESESALASDAGSGRHRHAFSVAGGRATLACAFGKKTKKVYRSVCRERDGTAPGIRHFAEPPIGMTTMTTLLEEFRSNYSATQNEEMGLEEYLELCKRDPAAYATAAERMLAGIGEPELVDTRNDPRLVADLRQPRHPALSGVPRVLRHGGRDRADRRVLQARGAGARGDEADPLSAGAGRRRQVVDRRAAEGGDGEAARSTRSRARRSTNRRSACSRRSGSARCWRRTTAFRAAISPASCRRGR